MKDDQSERTSEVERAFRDLLERWGMMLESLDATSASHVALEFFRNVSFDWLKPEDGDTYSASTTLEREARPHLNPLVALFSRPKLGAVETIVLNFDRVLRTPDDAFIQWSLDLEFEPAGLETLEEIDVDSDDFDRFEDFARKWLTNRALEHLTGVHPRSVNLWVG